MGGLYDSKHVANRRREQHQQPTQRFTFWEIHPITAVLVCKREDNNCEPIVSDDWTLSSRARALLPGDGEVKQWQSAALASGS